MDTDRSIHDAYTAETTRLSILTERSGAHVLAGVLIAFCCFALGWYFRGLFAMEYGYQQLAWLIPLATFLVAWGNRR